MFVYIEKLHSSRMSREISSQLILQNFSYLVKGSRCIYMLSVCRVCIRFYEIHQRNAKFFKALLASRIDFDVILFQISEYMCVCFWKHIYTTNCLILKNSIYISFVFLRYLLKCLVQIFIKLHGLFDIQKT